MRKRVPGVVTHKTNHHHLFWSIYFHTFHHFTISTHATFLFTHLLWLKYIHNQHLLECSVCVYRTPPYKIPLYVDDIRGHLSEAFFCFKHWHGRYFVGYTIILWIYPWLCDVLRIVTAWKIRRKKSSSNNIIRVIYTEFVLLEVCTLMLEIFHDVVCKAVKILCQNTIYEWINVLYIQDQKERMIKR